MRASRRRLCVPARSPTHSFEQYRQCRQRQGKVVNTERIKLKYRRNARFYDLLVRPLPLFERLRRKAVARLRPRPGETVVDLGCGTGLSFELLEHGVGPQGRIIGVEITPEMLAKAREKVARHGWSNVTLIEASAEEVDLEPGSGEAGPGCL